MRPPLPESATAPRSGACTPISSEVMARRRSSSVIIFRRVSERTRAISTMSDTGLVRKSSAPASRPRTRSAGLSSAVTMTTGMKWVAGLDLSRRQTSKPSMSGIITSSRMMSHSAREQICSASSPLDAVRTSKYSADRRASSNLTLAETSSTTRIRADTQTYSLPNKTPYGFNELADRNWLGQIGFAAALADALLVPLHRKCRDRNHRDGTQFRIVLDPACHFEAGDLRELDIHQDQIGAHLAHEIERLETVGGTRGLIAVRFQQIAKELHIELVVLHDQDGFCHPSLQSPGDRPACGASGDAAGVSKSEFKLASDSLKAVKSGPSLSEVVSTCLNTFRRLGHDGFKIETISYGKANTSVEKTGPKSPGSG